MKWAIGWWGMQILAETEEDKKLLEKLLLELPKKPEERYDIGEYKILDDDSYEDDLFSKEQLNNAKMIVEFLR